MSTYKQKDYNEGLVVKVNVHLQAEKRTIFAPSRLPGKEKTTKKAFLSKSSRNVN
jgi:hypothetical protein